MSKDAHLEANYFAKFKHLVELFQARTALEELLESLPRLRERALARLDEIDERLQDNEFHALVYVHDDALPKALASSFLIYTHAAFESALFSLAKEARSRRGLGLSLREIQGAPVERARTYFQKVVGLDIGDLDGWADLKGFQELRNAVVHRSCCLGDTPKKRSLLEDLSRRFPDLVTADDWTDENEKVRFGAEAVLQYMKTAEILVCAIVDLLYFEEGSPPGQVH